MNYVLDRYMNIIADPHELYIPTSKGIWNPERHLKYMLMELHHVCLEPNFEIYMIKITKVQSGGSYVLTHGYNEPQWVELKQTNPNATMPSK